MAIRPADLSRLLCMLDPNNLTLTYASAGHNPPRLKRCDDGSLVSLDKVGGFPLGITLIKNLTDAVHQLVGGDQIVFYTDGITKHTQTMRGVVRLSSDLIRNWKTATCKPKDYLMSVVLAVVNEHCLGPPRRR